jgi:hypothetical protein
MKRTIATTLILTALVSPVSAETPEEWISLGARVHGAFGAFIPLGIKIGLDAVERLKAEPRTLSITYFDSTKSPCACFADGPLPQRRHRMTRSPSSSSGPAKAAPDSNTQFPRLTSPSSAR